MAAMTARRFLAVLACLAAGCTPAPKPVPPVSQSGELVVLTVNGPASYFEDAQGNPSGLEYDLAMLFAHELKATPVFITADSPAKVERLLREGRAHLAAAALPRHFDFPGGLTWGPSYFTTQHQVVGRSGEPMPKALSDIGDRPVGVIDESVAEFLVSVPSKLPLHIDRLPAGTSTADLLEQVVEGRIDFALVESNRFTLARRYFPQLEVAFNVGKPVDYAWLVAAGESRKAILEAAGPFFERIRKDGTLKRLVDRYYGHAARITVVDSGTLIERIGTRLPELRAHFQEAEVVSGIDWRLVAALGYQESHWDADATSPTGVRGLMMLTDETAQRVQVKNRLDARESILGGARYLALIRETLNTRIPEPDRTYLALAAYNMGVGHLEDARIFAERAKLSPDRWQDVRQMLPRLSEPEWFQQARHGYARGFEAMQLVDNVRNYYDIISRLAPRGGPLLPLPVDDPPQLSTKGTAAGK
jgi:membrane-bound lytic murein transglycosylase F